MNCRITHDRAPADTLGLRSPKAPASELNSFRDLATVGFTKMVSNSSQPLSIIQLLALAPRICVFSRQASVVRCCLPWLASLAESARHAAFDR